MNFKFFMVFVILTIGFVGSIFAQSAVGEKEFTQMEIDEMKNKAVLITMNDGTFLIELFPEDAPNTVNNFLKLVENGYYDGMVFHRIISGFVIQTGDPNTKDLGIDRSLWGQGGPGYSINEEFNTLQHDRGMVSMARSHDVDSAGSQFFIVHKDSSFLDGKYTVFGRLVPGTHSIATLDAIANIPTDGRDAPHDVSKAMIMKANILDSFSTSDFPEPDRNYSIIEQSKIGGGIIEKYKNTEHKISFNLPYRWSVVEEIDGDYLDLIVEPTAMEHNVQIQIDETGFTPQLLIFSEERDVRITGTEPGPGFFSIKTADKPKILSDYIFENEDGRYAHLMVSTQIYQTQTETVKFKIMQIHFANSDSNYSVIYINVANWFRYEINSFYTVVKDFEIMIDGKQQPIKFASEPIFKRIIADARAAEEIQESPPPARIGGGCLIATATFGSEMAPQVQFLRELRDNTVLQTESGTSFMAGFNQFYYSFSPAIADYERENPIFKEAVKLIITPLLTSLTLLQYADIDSESDMLGYGIGIILLNIGMYFIAPAVLITKIRSFYKLQ